MFKAERDMALLRRDLGKFHDEELLANLRKLLSPRRAMLDGQRNTIMPSKRLIDMNEE